MWTELLRSKHESCLDSFSQVVPMSCEKKRPRAINLTPTVSNVCNSFCFRAFKRPLDEILSRRTVGKVVRVIAEEKVTGRNRNDLRRRRNVNARGPT
jgi:hypothetical protein